MEHENENEGEKQANENNGGKAHNLVACTGMVHVQQANAAEDGDRKSSKQASPAYVSQHYSTHLRTSAADILTAAVDRVRKF